MIRSLALALALLAGLTLFLPSTVMGDKEKKNKKKKVQWGEVTASRLNVRTGPSTRYKKTFSMPRGAKVVLMAEKNGWYYINYNGRKGWTSGKYIEKTVSDAEKFKNKKKVRLPGKRIGVSIGKVKVTYYWMINEKNYSGPKNTPIYDKNNRVMGYFPAKFVKALKLEGTAKLKNGKVVNVYNRGRFFYVKHPYGVGVRNIPLKPFRSIAVDRKLIPIGSILYIPQARGTKLPDGTVHDGYFYAHDVGGGIKGKHIDVFTGDGDQRKVFTRRGIRNLKKTEMYLVIKK